MTETVLILGATGKIGTHASAAFSNAGWTVRKYDRSTDMTQVAIGVDVIVNGLNPPHYHNWAETIPAITSQVISAAKASGATVIIPGNIYNFGNQPGLLDETTPQIPQTRKGKIRVEMEQSYRNAGVRTILLRAGNFIDPDGNGDVMSMLMMRAIKKGKLTAPGDPDSMQAYAYVPDWARAAVLLAEQRNTLATFEDVPFPGHAFTITQLRDKVEMALGRPVRLARFPWWLMTVLSPFLEIAREMAEMRYLYAMPHRISGKKFSRLLPDFEATNQEQVMLSGLPRDIYPDKVMRPGGHAVIAQ
ncbi:epimerase [Yoonia sediminilitoris]|uniref:Nucleoside-diphosphate-sugar epimerase n=1 Tax=Yoonia sediminilitoris TaxID=1286148 RepID=A0A2T6K838_9RHOB|nr:epimerase [Yoonia sediminilitoris]PUB10899.1 nucleoside-diphosphate-sugar epimerase [Yoonia sediminilitoris]RCW90574.1 nucleoside-diphosphate-sugar epimerase [Yoonia sediminilitoris]